MSIYVKLVIELFTVNTCEGASLKLIYSTQWCNFIPEINWVNYITPTLCLTGIRLRLPTGTKVCFAGRCWGRIWHGYENDGDIPIQFQLFWFIPIKVTGGVNSSLRRSQLARVNINLLIIITLTWKLICVTDWSNCIIVIILASNNPLTCLAGIPCLWLCVPTGRRPWLAFACLQLPLGLRCFLCGRSWGRIKHGDENDDHECNFQIGVRGIYHTVSSALIYFNPGDLRLKSLLNMLQLTHICASA